MTINEALAQAMAQLRPAIDNALANEVANVVKQTQAEMAQLYVYGVYSPKMYPRRGSFSDTGQMSVEVGGGRLTVKSTAKPSGWSIPAGRATTGKDLVALVEGGNGAGGYYDFWTKGAYMGPRPFIEVTGAQLEGSREHISALRSGLTRQGFKVK